MAKDGAEESRAITFLWRIQNFSFCEHGSHPSGFETPPVHSPTLGIACCLKLLPGGGNIVDKHLHLSFTQRGRVLDYPIDCEWSFLDNDDVPLASGIFRNRLLLSDIRLYLPNCPTKEEVFETRKSSFLPRDILTVRFRIWKSDGELDQAEHFSLFTRIDAIENCLVWPIDGFSALQLGQSVTITEDTFLGKGGLELKFFLTGASLPDSMINCEVIKSKQHKGLSFSAIKVSVLDNGQNAIKWGEKTIFPGCSNAFIFSAFVSRKELLEKKSECLRGDILYLRFVFTRWLGYDTNKIEKTYLGPSNLKRELSRNDVIPVSEQSCQTTHQSVEPPVIFQERSDSVTVLQDDFLSLYKVDSLSDFKLRSGDVSFPVHKNVLSARSPVFRAMFSSDMKESGSDSLDVPDVDAHSLNRMLTFLYAGTVDPLQWEAAGKLYYAADKYQVQSLKQQCSSFLRSGITVSNVSDILTLADKHFDQGLTSFVHDFILSHDNEIVKSDEWESFLEKDPRLAGKTMHEIYKKKLELD